jgi:hypothetical protein
VEGLDKKLMIVHTLTQDLNHINQVFVQVINMSTEEITIPANKLIAKLTLVTDVTKPLENDKEAKKEKDLRDEIEKAVDQTRLNDEFKNRLKKFLIARQKVFREPKSLGQANCTPVPIRTKADKPIATPMRRYSQVEHTEIASQTKSMLNKGVIKNSTSPWAVPVVLAKKKDGTW